MEQTGLVDHRPARESTRVATADEDPGRLAGCDAVSARHRQLHVVCEVLEVVYRLLDRVYLEGLDGEIVVRVGIPVESVLEYDGRRILLLGDLASTGGGMWAESTRGVCSLGEIPIRQVRLVSTRV